MWEFSPLHLMTASLAFIAAIMNLILGIKWVSPPPEIKEKCHITTEGAPSSVGARVTRETTHPDGVTRVETWVPYINLKGVPDLELKSYDSFRKDP
jgi:hypothetical protein